MVLCLSRTISNNSSTAADTSFLLDKYFAEEETLSVKLAASIIVVSKSESEDKTVDKVETKPSYSLLSDCTKEI